jgi:hypothetical protein
VYCTGRPRRRLRNARTNRSISPPEQVFLADELRFTRDPFDALIVAAAQTAGLMLVTRNGSIRESGAKGLVSGYCPADSMNALLRKVGKTSTGIVEPMRAAPIGPSVINPKPCANGNSQVISK